MKKFSFRLEAVRRIREQEEQLIQVELATALRERALVADQLDASREAEQRLYAYLRDNDVNAAELQHVSEYGSLHRQKIYQTTVQLRNHDQAVERIRIRLVDARARREALDRLRDRQQEQHRKAWLAEEGRELDEIGGQRHALRNAGLFAVADRDAVSRARGVVAT